MKKIGVMPRNVSKPNLPHIFRGWGGWCVRYNGASHRHCAQALAFVTRLTQKEREAGRLTQKERAINER